MFARLRALQSRYQKSAIAAFAVLATLLFAASQIYAPLNNYITRAGTLTYLTLLVVLDISLSTSRIESNATIVTVSHDHDELMAEMVNAAERSPHSTADLLEYAGVTVTPLVRKLREQDIRMRILIRNPALSGHFQRRRMLVNLEALYKSILSGYEAGFEIRCYSQSSALRGRRIGTRFLNLGWLTPDFKNDAAFSRVNPSISVSARTDDGDRLLNFFNKTFEDLWNHPDTVDGLSLLP